MELPHGAEYATCVNGVGCSSQSVIQQQPRHRFSLSVPMRNAYGERLTITLSGHGHGKVHNTV